MTNRVQLAQIDPALALSPLDGRYRDDAAPLIDFLSEAALNRNRVHVEAEWFIHLAESGAVRGTRELLEDEKSQLREWAAGFDEETIDQLRTFEAVTVHDVKAVEYSIKEFLDQIGAGDLAELVHFCCTSEDVNNLSYALGIKGAVEDVWLPTARRLVDVLADMAEELAEAALLSHTHGQPATPSTMGTELAVLVHRLRRQLARIESTEFLGKLNGATGTYAAHIVASPGVDWPAIAQDFVEHLGLSFNPVTTQIESHDWQAELFADISRFNRICHNLAT